MSLPRGSCAQDRDWSACLIAAVLAVPAGCGAPSKDSKAGATTPGATTPEAVKGTYVFWPQFPEEPRIQYLRSFGASTDVTGDTDSAFTKLIFGSAKTDEVGIQKPYGVAAHDGKIYVCDIRSASVTVLDLRKKQTRLIGISGVNHLSHPVAVAVADDGWLYVADNERGAVLVYDPSEKFARIYGHPKFKPVAVAVYGDRLYVCDLTAQNVLILNRHDGSEIGVIGKVGDEDGQFRVPLGISTDSAGNVYVMDMMRCRVQKFSPEGTLLAATGSLGDYAGTFARPKHIAVDRDGVVYVVDAAFQNVQMFDDQNRLLMHFGAAGDFPGSMNLPVGVCVNEDCLDLFQKDVHPGFEARRLVIVTNQFGAAKVSVYAVGVRRAQYTLQDLAAASAPIASGMGATPDVLKIQSQGNEELPAETDTKTQEPMNPDEQRKPAEPKKPVERP